MKNTLSFILLFCHSLLLSAQTIYHVNHAVSGGQHNGSSWADAFSELQAALAVANAGDMIWVVQGTYYPTPSTDRSISFVLKQGVKIYGGFEGAETTLEQRDWRQRTTILSGDIGFPDYKGDNSFHVLYCSGADSTTVLDGFEITRGEAVSNTPNYLDALGGGLFLEPSPNLYNTSPVIQNCSFTHHSAFSGGAIYCNWNEGDNLINPILRNCVFQSNRSISTGGAIHKKGPMPENADYIIDRCLFLDNVSVTAEGGAINLATFSGKTIFNRCVFERDSSKHSFGGALHISGFAYPQDGAKIRIDSCMFRDNFASEGGALAYYELNGSPGFFDIEIGYSNFERNQTYNGEGGVIFCFGFLSVNLNAKLLNSNFENNNTGTTAMISLGVNRNNFEVRNCKFIHNTGAYVFGAFNNALWGVNEINGTFDNCLFARNSNGIYFTTRENGKATTSFTHCTFYLNGQDGIIKTWYPSFDTSTVYGNHCYITNCIFKEPLSSLGSMFRNFNNNFPNMYGYHIDYSMLSITTEPSTPGWADAYGDHMFFKGTIPEFYDLANDDYRLKPCSPGVNDGDNLTTLHSGLLFDLNGAPRIYQDTVDMGAFETQSACFSSAVMPYSSAAFLQPSPNPVAPGGHFVLEFPEGVQGRFDWQLETLSGTRARAGEGYASDGGSITLSAPAEKGLYFLTVQIGGLRYRGKLLVLD